jgi:ABC-type Fe3+-hydroxamate transport system substrate-binding protein
VIRREPWPGDGDRSRLAGRVPPGAVRPRVFILRGSRPPRAAGDGVPDLVAVIGGEAFLPTPGSPGLEVSWEEVMEFDPQFVLISLCPPEKDPCFAPEDWMKIEGWNRVEAAAMGRVFSVETCLFSRPDAGLLEDARFLQDLVGEAFWGWPPCPDPRLRRLRGPTQDL